MIRSLYFLGFCGVICSLIPCNLSLAHDKIPCSPVGFCKCEFPSGLGMDLSLLRGSNFSIHVDDDLEVFFYPCRNVQLQNITSNATHNECKDGVSLCLVGRQEYLSLGSVAESQFVWERISDEPALVFSHNNKTTTVLLHCDEDTESFHSMPGSTHVFTLTSSYACVSTVEEEGHSVFSTLFIIILVLFLLYFFGGFCVLRFIRGARGWEAIPNGDFWKSVIVGTKKGFFYVLHGCKHPEPYDTI